VLAAELLARIVLDPIDYLLPLLVKDDFLIHRIAGFSGGHDAWGFRNTGTPESADIVCIGDSVTYGIAAKASESWPTVLGRIRKTSVYNMSLGGYGPIQYLHLMRTRAVKLHPKIVIVGFSLETDFWDVYYEVRYNKNWNAYGKLDDSNVKAPTLAYQPPPGKFLGGLRDWLAFHSVFYALLTRTSIFDFVRERELMTAKADDPSALIVYRDDKHNVIFNVSPGTRSLDMGDPKIKSGMEINKQVMLDMHSLAEKEAFRLIVAFIPTKESVYAKILDRAGYIDKYARLADAVHQEDVARDALADFLHQANIEVVDLLPTLRAEVDKHDLYPRTEVHPNKDGYRVIAETINNYLNSHR
jgi:lysophospholipase L1-like esterase